MKVSDFLGQVRSNLRGHGLDAELADDFESAVWGLVDEDTSLKFKTGVLVSQSEECLCLGVGVAGGEAENQIAAILLRQWFFENYPTMLSGDISEFSLVKDDVTPPVTIFLVRLNVAGSVTVENFLAQVFEKIGEMLSTSVAQQESLHAQQKIELGRSMIWQGMAALAFLEALTSVVKVSSEKSWYTDQQMSVLAKIAVEARGGFVPGSMFRVNNKEGGGLFVTPPVKDPCYFLDKGRQPQPAGERDDRQSVLLEVLDWFDRDPSNQQARVLYHLTYDNRHWVTVELVVVRFEPAVETELAAAIALSLEGEAVPSIKAQVYIHDPLTGCAEGRECDRSRITQALMKHVPNVVISEYASPYSDGAALNVRQDRLDGQNCGPIGCHDFSCLINSEPLVMLSATELAELRKRHQDLQNQYSEALVGEDPELEKALRGSAAASLEVEEVASDDAELQAALAMSLGGP